VDEYHKLAKAGASRFFGDDVKLTRSAAKVYPGVTESSGVEPIKELVTMIEAARAYQLNAQMVTLQDQTAGRLLSVVANT
jgi:flagellar basal body rod protein FlgG